MSLHVFTPKQVKNKVLHTVKFINCSSREDKILESYEIEDGGSCSYKGAIPVYQGNESSSGDVVNFVGWTQDRNKAENIWGDSGGNLNTYEVIENIYSDLDLYACFQVRGGGN